MKNQIDKVEELMANNVSIHVHFYTPLSMSLLLERAVLKYGFKNYQLIQRLNHKDFYFILR